METRYIALKEWAQYHPWPSYQGMRYRAGNRTNNGFARAFIKVGRRLLVDETVFLGIIANHKGSA